MLTIENPQRTVLGLLLVMAHGCREADVKISTPPPASAPSGSIEPTPTTGEPRVGHVELPAETRWLPDGGLTNPGYTGEPDENGVLPCLMRSDHGDETACPNAAPCLIRPQINLDAARLARNVWKHGWVFMNEPHCAERHDDMLRKVVDIESITALTGHCRAVVWAPERFGFAPGGIDVAIPPASAPLKRPKPTTARAINERFVRVHRVPSEQALFTGNELAAMTKSSFDNPTFRSGYVYDEARRDVRRKSGLLTMLVVYSPESSKVYVFEKRYPDRSDADLATRDARIRHDADAFLRSLGLASMRFPVELACEIPEELGGKEWYPIRLEP